ncbi:hypothetical protein E4U43_005612 [Claviceps pusilla]|uniref:Cell wall glycoprotein n=1 Tax=Claviceps pusilla TaxID=123648 RepID=A0A9P7ST88_9HYPO|nr:hypothetical protein E4U43_005612 [Claviceps pusilla]
MYSMKAAVVLGAAAVASAQLTTSRFSNATATADVVYTTEVVTAFTTYCPAATMIHIGNKTYTVTSATTLTITDCPCTIHKPVPTGPAGGADECAKKCNDQFDACQLAPDANHSFCASQLATCVGYNPFPNSGYKKPTACSAAAATTAAQPTGSPDCAAKCVDAFNKCQVAPDANHSFCASQLASCVGYNPFSDGNYVTPTACSAPGGATPTGTAPTGTAPTGTPPAVTAGAGHMSPALAMLALGAVALL